MKLSIISFLSHFLLSPVSFFLLLHCERLTWYQKLGNSLGDHAGLFSLLGTDSGASLSCMPSKKYTPIGKLSPLFSSCQKHIYSKNPELSSVNKDTSQEPLSKNLDKVTVASLEPLYKFLKSRTITFDEALRTFNQMTLMQPPPPMSSFNLLLGALVKIRRHNHAVLLCKRLDSIGFSPNFITLNIMLNCLCRMGRVSEGLAVLSRLFRRGYRPNTITLTTLIKGMIAVGKVGEATSLFEKMVVFGCQPSVVSYGVLINGLCQTRNMSVALLLFEEMVNGN
ncbi:hypothetical protein V6N11_014804 [Hibiscus sabdariffa]|uniref:Pentatricopeptide repeat-containing protein n=1 Tax=Hibiscus sabdariffa TaxID=183260 RepID=A0ABR2TQZ7_9ROSI